MNDANNTNWKPSPELLAAFADGELDSRDDAVELRVRIEEWLGRNPEAQVELAGNRRLKDLLERTAPPSPSSDRWREVIDRVEKRPAIGKRPMSTSWLVGAAAAAACVAWAVLLAGNYFREPQEVLVVAKDGDVEILHVEGNSFASIVVGRLPLSGDLELAETGEVASESPMDGQGRPMFPRRAKLDPQED